MGKKYNKKLGNSKDKINIFWEKKIFPPFVSCQKLLILSHCVYTCTTAKEISNARVFMFGAYKQAIAAAWINLDGNCCKTIFFLKWNWNWNSYNVELKNSDMVWCIAKATQSYTFLGITQSPKMFKIWNKLFVQIMFMQVLIFIP